jgi:16S rRNA (cytosine967-C5)-methyltransferase
VTPAARVAAAIEVLDAVYGGAPAERALTNWARKSRFAGSGDRAAVRDLVFDALRCRRSFAALGGGGGGRAAMIGALRANGAAIDAVFTGEGHAPARLTGAEREHLAHPLPMSEAERLDCPDWLVEPLRASLGEDFAAVMAALQSRAPVFLRVNIARTTRLDIQAALADEGIETRLADLADTTLEVTKNARKVQQSAPYCTGLVELQDAASQAVVADLPMGGRVLDYCAGGGGKTLALAARAPVVVNDPGGAREAPRFFAHDAAPARMRDLPTRADRAGVTVTLLETAKVGREAPYDLVLLDVPCSGSGSWRRAPQGKWALTPESLRDLLRIQAEILDATHGLVAAGGALAYVTCSLLAAENADQVAAFLARHPEWRLRMSRRLTPLDGGDGFFLAIFERN